MTRGRGTQESADAKVAALRVSCPYCNQPPYRDCQSANLWDVWPPHKSRIKIAHEVHTSPTALDADEEFGVAHERVIHNEIAERERRKAR